jgi:hypothetical protein
MIPNWEDDLLAKDSRIQITFAGAESPAWVDSIAHRPAWPSYDQSMTNAMGDALVSGVDLINPGPGRRVTDIFFNNFFGAGVLNVTIDPEWYNPWWETFIISVPQGTIVEQIVIDTWSHTDRPVPDIPEPSTYALFGLGAIVLVGWHRRRKKDA